MDLRCSVVGHIQFAPRFVIESGFSALGGSPIMNRQPKSIRNRSRPVSEADAEGRNMKNAVTIRKACFISDFGTHHGGTIVLGREAEGAISTLSIGWAGPIVAAERSRGKACVVRKVGV